MPYGEWRAIWKGRFHKFEPKPLPPLAGAFGISEAMIPNVRKVTMDFSVKDSGERAQWPSGMQRDVQTDKVLYDLVFDGPMFERYAAHLTKGARKYSPRNWMKACSQEELDRFRSSAVRHFWQWMRGDRDEDHAAAVMFNLNGAEYVKERLTQAEAIKRREALIVAQMKDAPSLDKYDDGTDIA